MDDILTVSTNNPLLNHVPLTEEMKESLPTAHPSSPKSSDTELNISKEDKAENPTITFSKTGVEFNTDPSSENGTKCTTPLSYEPEVEFVSQNAQFASKDIRYEKTVMKKLKQHTDEPTKVVKKKV